MTVEKSPIQQRIEKAAELGMKRAKNTAETMGVVGEPMTNEEQMAAWLELKTNPEGHAYLRQTWGERQYNDWVAEMQKRETQSIRQKVPSFEEVLNA